MCKTTKSESQTLHISNSQGNVTFLDDNMRVEEKQKVRMFIDIANTMITILWCYRKKI